jgi:2-polyprenyl-6-methoxyphenol hydroxylase-like FAD-dependent oxidoreductase
MTERVLVIGAGMAGLWTALALASTGRKVVVLERDPPAPDGGPDAAFESWQRRGVGHLRHSHAFLARLRLIIRDEHPELLKALMETGCRDLPFEGGLTDQHKAHFTEDPRDRDLAILTSRRTTLEWVIRRYVERQPNVEVRSGVFVRELAVEAGPVPNVTGVVIDTDKGRKTLKADIVVDAAGRTSQALEQLTAMGAHVPEEVEPCGIVYFTRHYRLNDGVTEPPRTKVAPTGDLEYLKFGVFPGDNGCFSITLCTPEIEEELRKRVVDPAVFDAVCRRLPGLAPWVDPATSTPISRVFGMGDLHNRWRDFAPHGVAAVTGYFAVGDALVRSNPLYGRGCSFAAVGADLLRNALASSPRPAARAVDYQRRITRELRPYHVAMRDADRSGVRRAKRALTPGYKPSLRGRLAKSFAEDGVAIAIRMDLQLFRAAMKGFHMLEDPRLWLRKPGNILKVLAYWSRGKKANAAAYRPPAGPERSEMLSGLGIAPQLDVERLAQAA